jgi:hypothetical protein
MTDLQQKANHLPDNFYTMPKVANMTLTRKQLRETLLYTGGWIIACGRIHEIKSKHLGAGVYRVNLERRT